MNRWAFVLALLLGFLVFTETALAATQTVVLSVDGMT